MSYSSDEEFSSEWVLYSKRREWSDVTPLPQDDGENPVVVIAYSDKCETFLFTEFLCWIILIRIPLFTVKDVFNYFRAVVASNEKSFRSLELTKDAVRLNPANYTVWQYRFVGKFISRLFFL